LGPCCSAVVKVVVFVVVVAVVVVCVVVVAVVLVVVVVVVVVKVTPVNRIWRVARGMSSNHSSSRRRSSGLYNFNHSSRSFVLSRRGFSSMAVRWGALRGCRKAVARAPSRVPEVAPLRKRKTVRTQRCEVGCGFTGRGNMEEGRREEKATRAWVR